MNKKLLSQYNRYEADNNHNAAASLLVNNFGTQDEKDTMKQIIARHTKLGFITQEDIDLRYKISQKYYKLITG